MSGDFLRYAKERVVGQDRALYLLDKALERVGKIPIFEGVAGCITLAGR
ncbi:MAG: hypothetical protein L3J42_01540 [Hydrogenimonas sp.]|nr:hypothetical protein [Hydrogenimonas sp.]